MIVCMFEHVFILHSLINSLAREPFMNHFSILKAWLCCLQICRFSVEWSDPVITFNLWSAIVFLEVLRNFSLFLEFSNFPTLDPTIVPFFFLAGYSVCHFSLVTKVTELWKHVLSYFFDNLLSVFPLYSASVSTPWTLVTPPFLFLFFPLVKSVPLLPFLLYTLNSSFVFLGSFTVVTFTKIFAKYLNITCRILSYRHRQDLENLFIDYTNVCPIL